MPRKLVEDMEPSLDTLIPQYAENKDMLDDYKKICDEENKLIKKLMLDQDEEERKVGDYIATCKVSTRESMNEDKLLEILKGYNVQGIIKTREYVDMDALESAIYEGTLDKSVLVAIDKCRISKEVVTLRVTKKGKK